MRRLRTTDGTGPHRRSARYHMARLRRVNHALHAQLLEEMSVLYAALKAKSREVEDAEDDLADAEAHAEAAEETLENALRDIDADLVKLDRAEPGSTARNTVFPHGFGLEIDPDGRAQLDMLNKLRTRLEPFEGHHAAKEDVDKLDAAKAALEEALVALEKAGQKVEALFAEELEVRRQVREQLESANGRLRAFYKATPGVAERFFVPGVSAPKKVVEKMESGPNSAPKGK